MSNFKYLLLSILLFSFSCNENREYDLISKYSSSTNSVNFINPYEQVGVEHNILMTEFVRLFDSIRTNQSIDTLGYPLEMKNWVLPIIRTTFYNIYPEATFSTQTFDSVYNEMEIISYLDNNGSYEFMFNQAKDYIDVYATNKDSIYTMNFLNDIKSLLDNYEGETDILVDFLGIINQHEAVILNEQWDSTESFSLGIIAVAKHSCQFWQQYFAQSPTVSDKHQFYFIQETKKDPKKGIEKGVVVASDAVGSIVGSIEGAMIGSGISPVAGTIRGYYVGKVVGAVSASSSALAVIELIDWWKKIGEW